MKPINVSDVQIDGGFLNSNEVVKINKFMTTLAEKFNKNLTLEKLVFYFFLKKELEFSSVNFLTKNKRDFFIELFAELQTYSGYWKKKSLETPLTELFNYVPEFFETINELFKEGENLPIPKLVSVDEKEIEIKNKEVIEFWRHFEPIIKKKEKTLNENRDHVVFLLCMKYLKEAGDNLPLNKEDVACFYELFRKGDMIIPSHNLKPYELTHNECDIIFRASKDGFFWSLVCFIFNSNKLFMNKKQRESLQDINKYINSLM